jgi:hypothetical protein
MCRGLAFALTLAALTRDVDRSAPSLNCSTRQQIIEEVSRLYVSGITDPHTRRALDAASTVRCVTAPLLRAMLPDLAAHTAYERLRELSFVQAGCDGLAIHDAVRRSIALTLRAQDPHQYRAYRTAAYRHFMSELRTAAAPDLGRCTANLLYLLEDPAIHEAFFPAGAEDYAVEPAQSGDGAEILEIIHLHEGPSTAASLAQWWRRAPETFVVARNRTHAVSGFYCALDPEHYAALCTNDPVTRAWMDHLRDNSLPREQRALFVRRWLTAETGEALSSAQAACWIDLQRKYLELRPGLRRVYLTLRDLQPYAAVARTLGFNLLVDRGVEVDGALHTTAMLDIGPSRSEGWIGRLVATELGVEDDSLLDYAARALVLNEGRTRLTKLEFGVMEYLNRHCGQVISRAALLENVWEQSFTGGSNVVDVVIRALRTKLGPRASLIETVRGFGYRLRREQ